MKTGLLTTSAFFLVAASLCTPAQGTWTGWVSVSQCGARGAHEGAGECTTKCVKEHGAKYVLVNEADKKVYTVDAQDKLADHAGQHVTATGSVDGDTLKLARISNTK